MRLLIPLLLSLASFNPGSAPPARQPVVNGYTVVAEWPHDPGAFTEGFTWEAGKLYEGTGLNGESELRRVDLETGAIKASNELSEEYFGEGVGVIGDRIYQVTWQENTAFVYDRDSFKLLRTHRYKGEGWGLTDHNGRLIMSNGTDVIRFRNPKTFRSVRRIRVTENGQPLGSLNELEWVKGEIWANVWPTDRIVRIDPDNGNVVGWLDLGPLQEAEREKGQTDVPNGIAYLKSQDRLFVTGKWWDTVYEIELTL
jgi:glutaminyl-peptide cyclotransferase